MKASLLNAIGNTPLVKIPLTSPAHMYAKLEYLNPGGSVKDRSALHMIEHAEKSGALKPGGTIVDASSGNQGIAVAMIGAVKGYHVIISVTEKISDEKLKTLRAYGAQVIVNKVTESVTDPASYHSIAVNIHQETPNSFMPNQYYNEQNRDAHYRLLGPEIIRQTDGRVTHFIAAAGTGGTVSGVGLCLKEHNPAIKVLAVDSPCSFQATNGNPKPYRIEGMGLDFISPVFKREVVDEILYAPDEESIQMLKTLSRDHGFLVGPSSGAVAYAAQEYAQTLSKDDIVVIIFGDSGRAYLSKDFYS